MKKAIWIMMLALLAINASAENLKPFSSDGCSSFPDGTLTQEELWLFCCNAHDFDYWKGGTYQERLVSDKALKACVSNVGEPEIALLMLAGVRVGGMPFLPTKFRWGYGWPYPRFYGELTASELQQVKSLTDQSSTSAGKCGKAAQKARADCSSVIVDLPVSTSVAR